MVAIHVFEGRFACGVMAARKHHGFQVGAIFAEPCFSFTRKLRQKGEVVTRVDQQIFLGIAREFIEVRHGAYAFPRLPQAFKSNSVALQSFTNMAR